jgi:hypothetical protein
MRFWTSEGKTYVKEVCGRLSKTVNEDSKRGKCEHLPLLFIKKNNKILA